MLRPIDLRLARDTIDAGRVRAKAVLVISVAMFSVAALFLFLATGFLRTARFWQDRVDAGSESTDDADYRSVVGGFYASGLAVLLGVLPAVVISTIVAWPAFDEIRGNDDAATRWALMGLLIASMICFAANLWQSSRAENPSAKL